MIRAMKQRWLAPAHGLTPINGVWFASSAIDDTAGLMMSTIAINLHNPTNLSPDAHAAINRTAIKQHRINPVGLKPH